MTSSECKSKINSTIECPVTYVNNNQKQMNIGRPPSSISLITDQLKLSSLNERDSCMSMRTMKMTVGVIPTTITTTTSKSMNTGQHNINCESYGLKTRNAYSMPIHSIIGLQLKRNITSNDNDSTNNNNTDWRSGSKDYHHSRTVHFHDVFAPSSSVCSSLRSTMSEFENGNEIVNLEPNSSSLHVLSASAPATNYSLNSMSNVLKFNEIQSCQQHYHHIDHPYHPHLHHRHHHHHHQINNSNNNTVTPSTSTFNFSSASFPCSVDDKFDHMNVLINQFNVPCKTVCSSPFSSSSSSTSCYFCSVCCSCCLFEVNNSSYSHIQHLHDLLPPAKRVCRSTSSSSDIHSQTSSYGYSCRPFPFIMSSCSCSSSSHIPPQPSSVSSYRHCHKCNNNDSNNNNNQHSSAAMLKTMQSYMRTLPRPIAVRLDSKIVYNEKSKSCTNMDNVKLLNSNDNNTNNGGGTLRNNNNNNNNDHGVILRPKPLDLNSFNKMNNGSRISWHHPLFNFGSGAAQTKCSNNNGNNLSSQTEVSEVTLQHNNSPTDFPQAHSDNLQKSVRLRNRTTHSNSSGGSSIHNNNSNNKSQFDRVHHRPSHIEIKDSQYSSLSIHALPSPSSAFTPTRASFGSFPMDVNSSEFSLSPTTESISSSIQITTRTPSSGFHEASFFGLSEASSLPDCSRFGVSSDSGPSSNHHCNCNCHQRRQQHYHHHHRRNQTNISIDNKSLNQSGNMSSKLTDLEPCFKLEDSEPNINDNHQSRNTSSSSSSSNSDSSSYCCSYSLPSVKCMLRCCSQPNDDTIYDINYRHSPHCSRTLKHIHQSPTTTTTTTNTTTCTFFTTISTTAMMITTKTSTTTSGNITIANTAAGLKRRRGPSGECNNQYCRDTDFHNESNNYHHHTHEEERKQLLAHEELLPCNCCMFKRTTDQLKNNHDGKSLSDIEHLNYMSTILSNSRLDDTLDCHHRHHYHQHHQSTCQCHDVQRHSMFPSIDQHSSMIPSYSCSSAISKCLSVFDAHKCQDNATLIESDIHDEHYHYLSSTASSIKHCTQPNLKNTTLMMDNNENGKITEAVNDNSCSVANSLRNPCYISSYEHCSSVFSEENLIHRYTYNELGKLYEMTEDEKEHETPETMIDENSNNGRISETNYHHPIILLSSPPIHEIAFTPIHPSTNIEWDNSDDRNSDSCRIPVHNHPDVLLNESVDTNLKDDSTGRQVLLFTPSSTSSNSDRESDDMKSILSPQTPNRQRTCSDILQEKSNNNKQTLSFTDLDLELIEND